MTDTIEKTGYDAVIIGAGIAGGMIALSLARQKKRVLILDAGDGIPASREGYMDTFYHANAKIPSSPYPNNPNAPHPTVLQNNTNGYFNQTGPVKFGSSYERTGGGTTWHWLGTSLRFLPHDFEMKRHYGVMEDWPITYADLEEWYGKAEYEIGVAANKNLQDYEGITFPADYEYPMEQLPESLVDSWIAAGVNGKQAEGKTLNVTPTPAGRNGPYRGNYTNGRRMCAGNTNCVPICPIQAKYDATITLNDALQTGWVEIAYKSVVNRIETGSDGEIAGVHFLQYEDKSGGPITPGVARGKIYVGAAHAIETAKILLMSNVANSSGQVGKNLMDHPVFLAWAHAKKPIYPYRGPLSTSGIENLRDGPFRSQHSAFRIEIGNEGWNWTEGAPYTTVQNLVNPKGGGSFFGSNLRNLAADDLTRQFRFGFLVEQSPSDQSYIKPSETLVDALGVPRPEVHYYFDDYTKRGFQAAYKVAQQLMGMLDVENVQYNAAPSDGPMPPQGPDGPPTTFDFEGVRYSYSGAGHVVGTYRMGSSATTSVINGNGQSWDHPNLYLVGSGAFPTLGTANPTLTIAALALRAANTINNQLNA